MGNYRVPDRLMQQYGTADDDNTRRLIRIETRLARLMLHLGLTAEGHPLAKDARNHQLTDNECK